MRRLIVPIICILLLAAGCGRSAEDRPIRIGILVATTGQFSSYGQDNLAAAELFCDDINARGGINGRPVELVVYNTESSPSRAVVGARRMIEKDRVAAIVGMGLVSESSAVAPLVENGPVTWSTCAAYRPTHRMMFVGGYAVPDQLGKIADWLRSRGASRIALITTNDATGQVAEAGLRAHAERTGLELVTIEMMNPADVDASAQLARIAASDADALIAWVIGRPLGVVFRSAQAAGVDLPLFTSSGNRSLDMLADLAPVQPTDFFIPSPIDAVWEHLPADHPAYAINQEFHARYTARFDRIPGSGSTTAYDALSLLAKAFAAVGTEPDAVRQHVESTTDYQGLVGRYGFSPQDHRGLGIEGMIMARVQQGRLVPAE